MLRALTLFALVACQAEEEAPTDAQAPACERFTAPSDDPDDWDVDAAVDYVPTVSEPVWVIPDLSPVEVLASNNNVNLLVTDQAWFIAWRTSPTHFASPYGAMHVARSDDEGATWVHEHTVTLDADMREPHFLLWDGRVSLSFFEGGDNPTAFEPKAIWRAERGCDGTWTEAILSEGEQVPWDIKVRGARALRTSYSGPHYQGPAKLSVHFDQSTDGGVTWTPVGQDPVLSGVGDSEVAFELDETGSLWAVTRNEDGDDTGQGAKVCTAPAADLSSWTCPTVSDPERYDSPEMIRHGVDLYLLARRDVGGPFGEDDGLTAYSLRPKRSALYQIDRDTHEVVHLFDIPGVGDTAFVSARRTGPHSWLFANYTAPLDEPDVNWLVAQTSDQGTQIYIAELTFIPE